MMPGEYLAILGVGSTGMVEARGVEAVDESAREIGYITTKFEITGLAITDKDVNSARAILSCMADVHNENKKKGEKVFDNMMLEPMFSTIVELLNNVVEKRDISLYTDLIKYNITLTGPIIKEGKYFWPMIREGKYVEYRE